MEENIFGRRLRALRRQHDMSQAELGGDELSPSYISLLESGKRPPTPDVVLKLADRLGIPTAQLTGDLDLGTSAGVASGEELLLRLRTAELHLLDGDARTAHEHFQGVFDSPDADTDTRAEALLGQARCRAHQGQVEEAVALYEQWLADFGDQRDDCVRWVRTVVALCLCRKETGRLDEAADLAEDSLRTLRDLGLARTPVGLELLAVTAQFRWDRGAEHSAVELLEEAYEAARNMNGHAGAAHAYWQASSEASGAGRLGKAVVLAEQAILDFEGAGDPVPCARLRAVYATVLFREGVLTEAEALRMVDQAVDELRERGQPTDIAYCETERSRMLVAAGRPESARESACSALERLDPAWAWSRSRAQLALARALWELSGPEESAALYEEAVAALEQLGLPRQQARAHLELAELQDASGDARAALTSYRRASAVMGLLPQGTGTRVTRGVARRAR
ncbi:helix-turn-helix domain-containing protein [Streptomyces sp. TR1341]|uniref:helix-turn-helix domain-containing protein n=1 Tax=Streptomyces sp. TR1341 TaxID=2601266 RepID=UPI00138ACCF6